MTTTTPTQIEGTGEKYDLNKLLDMRLRTRHAVYKIAAGISVGMVEEDARAMARDVLKSMGMRQRLAPRDHPLGAEHDERLHGAI